MRILHLADTGHKRVQQLIEVSSKTGDSAFLLSNYTVISLITVIHRIRPQVLHVHEAAEVPRLARSMASQLGIGIVRTVSELPANKQTRQQLFQELEKSDTLSTPYRFIQYYLLTEASARAAYIPDGYTPADDQAIPLKKQWGLTKGHYSVVLTDSLTELKWLVQGYAQSATARKLIYPAPHYTRELQHLQQVYPFFRVLKVGQQDQKTAIVRQAAAVLHGSTVSPSPDLLLQAMDASRPILATNASKNAEILGTAGLYVKKGDMNYVAEATISLLKEYAADNKHGQKAHSRAQHHFLWSRVIKDYMHLYRLSNQGAAVQVPLDSAVSHA